MKESDNEVRSPLINDSILHNFRSIQNK